LAGLVLVRDIMTKNPKIVRRDTTVQEIVATMAKFDISSVIVAQEERPVGIVTHKDIVSKVVLPRIPPDALKAREVMSTPVVKIKEDASIEEAASLMAKKRIKKLVAVSGDGDKLVGIITSMDIVKAEPKLTTLIEKAMKTL
jgi:CBS domain-containing protein